MGLHGASSTFKLTLMKGERSTAWLGFLVKTATPKTKQNNPRKVLCTMQTNYFHGKFNYCDPNR